MKTAISIPERVFADAERLARRLGKSRSRLYSEAVAEYVLRHAPDEITDALDRACAKLDGEGAPFVRAAGRRVLERSPW
jgi:metal-responsive CopG/Arc/MetJ family transcriptional regulator